MLSYPITTALLYPKNSHQAKELAIMKHPIEV